MNNTIKEAKWLFFLPTSGKLSHDWRYYWLWSTLNTIIILKTLSNNKAFYQEEKHVWFVRFILQRESHCKDFRVVILRNHVLKYKPTYSAFLNQIDNKVKWIVGLWGSILICGELKAFRLKVRWSKVGFSIYEHETFCWRSKWTQRLFTL